MKISQVDENQVLAETPGKQTFGTLGNFLPPFVALHKYRETPRGGVPNENTFNFAAFRRGMDGVAMLLQERHL